MRPDVENDVHPRFFIEADRPSDAEVEAAARALHVAGQHHGWWLDNAAGYDQLDPIGKVEFDAIVEHLLMSAAAAKRGVSPDAPWNERSAKGSESC